MPSPRTILIVDDDVGFCSGLTAALQGRGFRVVQAVDGAHATAIVQTEEPSLLVVAETLPDADGIEWVRTARAEGVAARAVLVCLTRTGGATSSEAAVGIACSVHRSLSPEAFAERVVAEAERTSDRATPPAENFEAVIRTLRQEYLAELPGQIEKLHAAVRTARCGDDRAIDRARVLAHRLRGSAGSYGLENISARAGALEDALVRFARSTDPSGALWSEIDTALDRLINARTGR